MNMKEKTIQFAILAGSTAVLIVGSYLWCAPAVTFTFIVSLGVFGYLFSLYNLIFK